MTTQKIMNDPAHWHTRADEARAVAAAISDPEARRMMITVAEGYESLARRAEERLARLQLAR